MMNALIKIASIIIRLNRVNKQKNRDSILFNQKLNSTFIIKIFDKITLHYVNYMQNVWKKICKFFEINT